MSAYLCADIHFGKKSAAPGDILKVSLSFISDCKSRGIKKIYILGDLMENRATVSYRTLRDEVRFFLSEARREGIEVTVLAGNHDFPFMDKRTPSNLRNLDLEGARIIDEITYEGEVVWIPWLYHGEKLSFKNIKIGLGHLAINGMKMNQTYIADSGIDAPTTTVPLLLGDFHLPQEKGNIRYLGSPVHLTFNDANTERFGLVMDDNLKIVEEVPLNDRFINKIQIDLGDPGFGDIKIPPGAQVRIKGVEIGDVGAMEAAIFGAGAGAVDIQTVDPDVEDSMADVPETLSVEEAIEELISLHEGEIEHDLLVLHNEMLKRTTGAEISP